MRSKLTQQLAMLGKWPIEIIEKHYRDYPKTFGYLKKMWTQIIKKLKQQQKNSLRFGNDDNNDNNHSDASIDSNNGDDSSESMYSPPESKNKSKVKGKNKRKKKGNDKEEQSEGEEEEEEEEEEHEEITLNKVKEHVEEIVSKKRGSPKLSRFGNNSLFLVYYPSFQDKAVALEVEKLIDKAQQRVYSHDDGAGILKFVSHRGRRTPKYIVIEQELTSEQLKDISSDSDWWKTYAINIITTDSLFNQLMKWNQLNGAIKEPTTMKLWGKWKQMINDDDHNNENDKENNNENDKKNDNEIEILDLSNLPEPVNDDDDSAELKGIKFEYEKVTKNADQYLLSSDNIWRLYEICNQNTTLHQQFEVISTEVVSYICGIEWDDNEEKQSKLNNNPCWDENNQKRKDGTAYTIQYGMKFIFGSGNDGMDGDWWTKKALFFTLNDVPITYDCLNSEKQYAGQHWFSMAVQQYHDNQSGNVTSID